MPGMFGPTPMPRIKQRTANLTPKNYSSVNSRPQRKANIMPKLSPAVSAFHAGTTNTVTPNYDGVKQSALQRQNAMKASLSRFAGTNAAKNMNQVRDRVAAAAAARKKRGL